MTFHEAESLDRIPAIARRQVSPNSPAFPIGEEPFQGAPLTHSELMSYLIADALASGATEEEIAMTLGNSPEA